MTKVTLTLYNSLAQAFIDEKDALFVCSKVTFLKENSISKTFSSYNSQLVVGRLMFEKIRILVGADGSV
jgi:hypothetical protein